jgi:hypothetical protein
MLRVCRLGLFRQNPGSGFALVGQLAKRSLARFFAMQGVSNK